LNFMRIGSLYQLCHWHQSNWKSNSFYDFGMANMTHIWMWVFDCVCRKWRLQSVWISISQFLCWMTTLMEWSSGSKILLDFQSQSVTLKRIHSFLVFFHASSLILVVYTFWFSHSFVRSS
jgi:hypothetical protein